MPEEAPVTKVTDPESPAIEVSVAFDPLYPSRRAATPVYTTGWLRADEVTMSDASETPLRRALSREVAEEWALVLLSAGVSVRVRGSQEGFSLDVAPELCERAEAILAAYELENEGAEESGAAPVAAGLHGNSGLALAVALIVFHLVTGPRDPSLAWFEWGSADAERILAGELWRPITALTLHADFAHVLGNALIGGFFVAALCGSVGPGVGFAALLAAGAGGNLLNAFVRSSGHVGVGASTAVFGAVGLLVGLGVARRQRLGFASRRAWAPVAAGLGILAMLGAGGGRTDLWAHLFGLLTGAAIGLLASRLLLRPPGAWLQGSLGILAAALLLGSWWVALWGRC
jgi:membrane associated rhomboid family serine protease